MKKVLGLDLGTTSIGWALVNEAESNEERSSIIKIGVRVNPLSTDEVSDFEKGKAATTNANRRLKRCARRNLQRFKLRREALLKIFKDSGLLTNGALVSENGNKSTFETYKLRAKAANEEISLHELARVLLMINKKRGYKSSRKAKTTEEGQLIDGMEIAKKLYHEGLTPGQLILEMLDGGKKQMPDFYRSDLQAELDRIWEFQSKHHPNLLTNEFKIQLRGKSKTDSGKIFLGKYKIFTADNKGSDKLLQATRWRVKALTSPLAPEELAFVICALNGSISSSSGYLGNISDRSKELFFNKQTVGQYIMAGIANDPHFSTRNKVFYRQDYLDEFEQVWETQAKFHQVLTPTLKETIRDTIIFYQRRLKSKKFTLGFCEFENEQIEVTIDGRKKRVTRGSRVCPKSSPLFQEFKIWQNLNNLILTETGSDNKRPLRVDEMEQLYSELQLRKELKSAEALKILYKNHSLFALNFEKIEGNRTNAALFEAYQKIIELSGHESPDINKFGAAKATERVQAIFSGLGFNTAILSFNPLAEGKAMENQPYYKLWHLLYSYEGDGSRTGNASLVTKIGELAGMPSEYAAILANVQLQQDYGSLSAKAIRKILIHLKEGFAYGGRKGEPSACEYAGYKHSKESLDKEEIKNKELKPFLDNLPKNSLRNPVVEKILNQLVNLVNNLITEHGRPDEIRIELARELKNNAKRREEMTKAIKKSTEEHEAIKGTLTSEFGLSHVSRNDIIRYKLYEELKFRGYKTLYSDTYIPRERLFSKDFDIEHIIPQSRLFDDSFSNKTLEKRDVNIEKGNETAHDYIAAKHGQAGLIEYLNKIEEMNKAGKLSKAKYQKLKMKGVDIPDNFLERDLRDTQYITKVAKAMLGTISRTVISTTGSITDRLRDDWQLVDVMQELSWDKYEKLGLTEVIIGREGQRIKRIKDWTKRDDHRHHAMDALTVAFTKHAHVQYLNNLNARDIKTGNKPDSIYGIEKKELYRDDRGKLKFKPPMPINDFRAEAKKHLESVLVSIKAKNKVTTRNINSTKKKNGTLKKIQLTPRGQLHNETVYGSLKRYETRLEKVGTAFNEEKIMTVAKKSYREALLQRLRDNDGDPVKAFGGKNSPLKNPVYTDPARTLVLPEKVKTVELKTLFTIRKDVAPGLNVEKVIDPKVRRILEARLVQYNGDDKKAFANLDENPIWLNPAKGIAIKRVAIFPNVTNAQATRDKRDKDGNLILDANGKTMPVDYVNTANNHHAAIYRDEKGNLQDVVVSFMEAAARVNAGLEVVDKDYNKGEGWQFLFTLKTNEYFVFPNEQTGFKPTDINLLNPENYHLISPNLFRVQKFSKQGGKDYYFRHHLETRLNDTNLLKGLTFKRINSLNIFQNIVKVRVNHFGKIVAVGEY